MSCKFIGIMTEGIRSGYSKHISYNIIIIIIIIIIIVIIIIIIIIIIIFNKLISPPVAFYMSCTRKPQYDLYKKG